MLIKIGIARVTQLLKPELELSTRMEKLASRLTFGVASAAADLARVCGDRLTRGEYLALVDAWLCLPEAIDAAKDARLAACLEGGQPTLRALREAFVVMRSMMEAEANAATEPVIAPYEA